MLNPCKEALEEALVEPDASAQVSSFWASKIDQKGTGEGPVGRKEDVTKVKYLSGTI